MLEIAELREATRPRIPKRSGLIWGDREGKDKGEDTIKEDVGREAGGSNSEGERSLILWDVRKISDAFSGLPTLSAVRGGGRKK